MQPSDIRITSATTIEDMRFALEMRRHEFETHVLASAEVNDRVKQEYDALTTSAEQSKDVSKQVEDFLFLVEKDKDAVRDLFYITTAFLGASIASLVLMIMLSVNSFSGRGDREPSGIATISCLVTLAGCEVFRRKAVRRNDAIIKKCDGARQSLSASGIELKLASRQVETEYWSGGYLQRTQEGEKRNRVCLAVIDTYPNLAKVIHNTPSTARLGLLCALELGAYDNYCVNGIDAIYAISRGEIPVPIGATTLLAQANDAIATSQ